MLLHEGREYARVSDILKLFSDFSHIDESVLKNKCDIGTIVHQAIADDIAGEFPSLPGDKAFRYFKSFLMWKDTIGAEFVQSEQRYFDNEKMLTGAIDALIKFPGDLYPTLIDFKTSAQESKETWPMQAHLYDYLLSVNGIRVMPRYLFIKLDKNGQLPKVFEYKFQKNIIAKCLNAIVLFWKNKQD